MASRNGCNSLRNLTAKRLWGIEEQACRLPRGLKPSRRSSNPSGTSPLAAVGLGAIHWLHNGDDCTQLQERHDPLRFPISLSHQ